MGSGFVYLNSTLLFIQDKFKTIQHPFLQGYISYSWESGDLRAHYKTEIHWVATKLGELKMETELIEGQQEKWSRL